MRTVDEEPVARVVQYSALRERRLPGRPSELSQCWVGEVGIAGLARTLVADAARLVDLAWARLQSEYELQKLGWEFLQSRLQSEIERARHQGMVAAAQSKIDFAKSVRVVDPTYAVTALETLLKGHARDGKLLSMGMAESVQGAIEAEGMFQARRGLVDRLDAVEHDGRPHATRSEECCSGAAATSMRIQELVAACELGDTKLVACMQQALSFAV